MLEQITNYYTNYDEDGRLKRDNIHLIEYQTTLHFLKKNLPKDCNILDCCAGCGVYTFPLAEFGHKVTAGDLMKKHVGIMNFSEKRNILENVYTINVLDMSQFTDDTFDVFFVLVLSIIYKRSRIVREPYQNACEC